VENSETSTLDFLTKHFFVLSLALALVASAISMLFLAAYLSVFDWTMVWLVEYADLTKFFLLGTALILTVVVLASSFIYTVTGLAAFQGRQRKIYGWIVFGLICLFLVPPIYLDIRKGIYFPSFHLSVAASAFLALPFLRRFARPLSSWWTIGWRSLATEVTAIAFTISVFAATFGYYVRDVSQNAQEITTKDATYTDAKIVMMLSHHTAFISHGMTVVLPTSDVTKIISQGSSK
jgi:hypothetical protein